MTNYSQRGLCLAIKTFLIGGLDFTIRNVPPLMFLLSASIGRWVVHVCLILSKAHIQTCQNQSVWIVTAQLGSLKNFEVPLVWPWGCVTKHSRRQICRQCWCVWPCLLHVEKFCFMSRFSALQYSIQLQCWSRAHLNWRCYDTKELKMLSHVFKNNNSILMAAKSSWNYFHKGCSAFQLHTGLVLQFFLQYRI